MLRVEERGFKGDNDPKRQIGWLVMKPAHKQNSAPAKGNVGMNGRRCPLA
jgi:hypothetical protein